MENNSYVTCFYLDGLSHDAIQIIGRLLWDDMSDQPHRPRFCMTTDAANDSKNHRAKEFPQKLEEIGDLCSLQLLSVDEHGRKDPYRPLNYLGIDYDNNGLSCFYYSEKLRTNLVDIIEISGDGGGFAYRFDAAVQKSPLSYFAGISFGGICERKEGIFIPKRIEMWRRNMMALAKNAEAKPMPRDLYPYNLWPNHYVDELDQVGLIPQLTRLCRMGKTLETGHLELIVADEAMAEMRGALVSRGLLMSA